MTNQYRDAIDALLRPLGFRRKHLTWRRSVDTGTQVVSLQRSRYGPQAYVNFGLWCGLISPQCRSRTCDVQSRLGQFSAALPDAVDLESDEHLQQLEPEVVGHLLPWLTMWETSDGLAAFLRKPISRKKFLVAAALRRLAQQQRPR